MLLTAEQIADITGGEWLNPVPALSFHGIRVNIERIEKDDICFTSNPRQWGKGIPDTEEHLTQIFAKGAAAAVVTDRSRAAGIDRPVLVVEDSRQALEAIALYARDNVPVKRVLVTGTEGKTGFKNQLYQLLNFQTRAHATLDSSNLNVPILCSMASIGDGDEVEVIEASVADGKAGVIRSNLVRPDICVLTEVGFEHITSHGSFENLIANKASITDGLKEGGICALNADSVNYELVREAIYRRKYVDLVTFGSGRKCNARLLKADFDSDELVWHIGASVEGIPLSYSVPALGEHVPVSSLAPLLVVHRLGYDVRRAAADFIHFRAAETMGRIDEVVTAQGSFRFYNHSHRASVLSYASALKDLGRLRPRPGGRKIAVIGNMLNIGEISRRSHEDLAPLIEKAGVDRLYTVGRFALPLHSKLKNPAILVKHGDKYQEIEAPLLADLRDGDLLFMKGHHRIWLKDLADKIYALGTRREIR